MKELLRDVRHALCMGLLVPLLLLPNGARLSGSAQGSTPEFTQRQEEGLTVTLLGGEELPLERYVVGVVLGEMPADFHQEALKAQAVAARTYTCKILKTGGKHGDGRLCTDPVCCQAYLDPLAYPETAEAVEQAVEDTQGLVLCYDGELIEAVYFSCSGGKTEDALAVWGTEYPYLRATDSPGEEASGYYRSSKWLSREELELRLGFLLPEDSAAWLGELTRTEGGGVEYWELAGHMLTGVETRKALELRSTAFSVSVQEQGLLFVTQGYGHRVGLSQYGANAMAQQGKTFRQILSHYYLGTDLVEMVAMENEKWYNYHSNR